jgi:hypothetical protein
MGDVLIYDAKHFSFNEKCYELTNADFDIILDSCALMKSAHEQKYSEVTEVGIACFYGVFENGAVVAYVYDDKANYLITWSEEVGEYTFNYPDGNRIEVLYNGELYTLCEAYNNGYITDENLANIYSLHQIFLYYFV